MVDIGVMTTGVEGAALSNSVGCRKAVLQTAQMHPHRHLYLERKHVTVKLGKACSRGPHSAQSPKYHESQPRVSWTRLANKIDEDFPYGDSY